MKRMKLLPCPFCGSKPSVSDGCTIFCASVTCFGPEVHSPTFDDAAELWNARAPQSQSGSRNVSGNENGIILHEHGHNSALSGERTVAASTAALSADDAWNELLEKDDRNSPEDYPEMCLITVEELRDFMRRATSRDEGCTVSRHGRDTATDGAA